MPASSESLPLPDQAANQGGPRHLYVHIPFCRRVCPYCGFYKHQPGKLANRAFVSALLAELRRHAEALALEFDTIFLGGGTPSLLSPTHLEALLGGIAAIADLSRLQEWTMEANPGTFNLEKAALARCLGVTRASLGVQSWQPGVLATLGRDHSPAQAEHAYSLLREAGIPSVSLDLIFSVPGQNLASWRADLEQTIRLRPDHVSAYNLTYEEDTEFLSRHLAGELDDDEDRDADQFALAGEILEEAGYRRYEISNYARPGQESRHNQAYWSGADYLGIGPGAVSTVRARRWKNLPDTAAWVERTLAGQSTEIETERIGPEERRLEALALQLRTADGVPETLVRGTLPDGLTDRIETFIQQGLLERTPDQRLRLTREGQALADPIAAALA